MDFDTAGSVMFLLGIGELLEERTHKKSVGDLARSMSLPVKKETGSYVYAGTAVEEGEITICVKKVAGSTRFERIVTMIEESEKLKSSVEGKAAREPLQRQSQ